MRNRFCLAAFLSLVATAAFAGDGYGPPSAPGGWGGAYIGMHAGYGWGTSDLTNSSPPGPDTRTESVDIDGILAGVQAGYNFQHQGIVIGAVANFSFTDMSGTNVNVPPPGPSYTVTASVDWMATFEARAGFLMRPETLIYVHGGLAIADVEGTWLTDPHGHGGPGPFRGNDSSIETGWVAGLGIEHRIDVSKTIFLEYAHIDLGNRSFSNPAGAGPAITYDQATKFDTVKVGFNIRF